MSRKDKMRTKIAERYPEGANLTAEGMLQFFDKVWDYACKEPIPPPPRKDKDETPFGDIFTDLFGNGGLFGTKGKK